ncbi:MAG TPA: hypothetical protein VF182_06450 [Candidatus Binatia bacterium]
MTTSTTRLEHQWGGTGLSMWNTFSHQWDYLVLNLIVGVYMMLGAALGLTLMWLFLTAPTP